MWIKHKYVRRGFLPQLSRTKCNSNVRSQCVTRTESKCLEIETCRRRMISYTHKFFPSSAASTAFSLKASSEGSDSLTLVESASNAPSSLYWLSFVSSPAFCLFKNSRLTISTTEIRRGILANEGCVFCFELFFPSALVTILFECKAAFWQSATWGSVWKVNGLPGLSCKAH